jgi:phosphonate dehydrogenase
MEDWARPDRPRRVDPALLAQPRTVLTPHLGSAVAAVRRQVEQGAADTLAAYFAGQPMPGWLSVPR